MTSERTVPDEATREAERSEALRSHLPDREPTPEEERLAEGRARTVAGDGTSVAAHFEEMAAVGASVRGEGALDDEHAGGATVTGGTAAETEEDLGDER